jgi:hypothetical protein
MGFGGIQTPSGYGSGVLTISPLLPLEFMGINPGAQYVLTVSLASPNCDNGSISQYVHFFLMSI